MTQIVLLIRHGDVAGDAAERFIGHTDLPLSAAGEDRMRMLAGTIEDVPLDAIYCSGLQRSRRSADILAAGRSVRAQVVAEFAEINLGAWEGLSRRDVAVEHPADYVARGRDIVHFHPPQGESFADLAARVLPAWWSIVASPHKIVAVVAHAGVNRVILCTILGMPLANLFRIAQHPGGVTVLAFERRGVSVRILNAAGVPRRLLGSDPNRVSADQPGTTNDGARRPASNSEDVEVDRC